MENIEIRIDEKFLENFGTGSLLGYIHKNNKDSYSDIKKIKLLFPQTSPYWRIKNKGPYQYIVNEFTIRCLLEDVITLIRDLNIEVTIDLYLEDPK